MYLMKSLPYGKKEHEKLKKGTCVGTVSTIVDVKERQSLDHPTEWNYAHIAEEIELSFLTPEDTSLVHQMIVKVPEVSSKGYDDVR